MVNKIKGAAGNLLFQAEVFGLGKILPEIFGYHLLQLGGSARCEFLRATPIKNKIYFNTDHNATIRGNFHELPFVFNSIDLVVAPHVLEFSKDPQKILSEIYHVLIPDGTLIIIGFNPFSLWGLLRRWQGRYISAGKVQRWLTHMGFRIILQESLFFRPPLQSKSALRKTLFMESMGPMLWPDCGAIYVIVAKTGSGLDMRHLDVFPVGAKPGHEASRCLMSRPDPEAVSNAKA